MTGSRYVRVFFNLALYGGLLVVVTACFKNPGKDLLPLSGTSIPITPVYNGVTDSYLYAHAACGGLTSVVLTWSSSLTSEKTTEAVCKNDKLVANLAVSAGDKAQVFRVQI